MNPVNIRNVCVIAHVDHGKTTLVDSLFRHSGMFRKNERILERAMDDNELERERGITIFSKNASIRWKEKKINIVDTPGHSDFGGEVQRILKMVDGALLLVDAVDGPMPQTKYVLENALKAGLAPIVVINKIDRKDARPSWVLDKVFDLFVTLGANDEQLDFVTIYASAKNGISTLDPDVPGESMTPLLDAIIETVKPPVVEVDGQFQMLATSVEYSDYMGRMAVGKITRGGARVGDTVARIDREGNISTAKLTKIFGFEGMKSVETDTCHAGDIVTLAGFKEMEIGDTVADKLTPEPLPPIDIDEPTVSIFFSINNSPFAGQSGDKLTGRHLDNRLQKELRSNMALKVERGGERDSFKVSGRGELHLSILIETMRREGYEFSVSGPEIIITKTDKGLMEPEEFVIADVDEGYAGKVIEKFGARRGELRNMGSTPDGRTRMEFTIPARGLLGMYGELLSETRGSIVMTHTFHRLIPWTGPIQGRQTGSIIAQLNGTATGYTLDKLSDRGEFFIDPAVPVYGGMVIGERNKSGDIVVNVCKGKKLTNTRAAGSDDNIKLTPARKMSLERTLEYLNGDELAEVTPDAIRIRKKYLNEEERKKHKRVTMVAMMESQTAGSH